MEIDKQKIDLLLYTDLRYNPRKEHHYTWLGPYDAEHYFKMLISRCNEPSKLEVNKVLKEYPIQENWKMYRDIITKKKYEFNQGNYYLKASLKILKNNYMVLSDYLRENYSKKDPKKPISQGELYEEYQYLRKKLIQQPFFSEGLIIL